MQSNTLTVKPTSQVEFHCRENDEGANKNEGDSDSGGDELQSILSGAFRGAGSGSSRKAMQSEQGPFAGVSQPRTQLL